VLGTIAISLGVTAVAAVIDVHRTLQFIGTYSVLATLGTVPVRYDSLEVRDPCTSASTVLPVSLLQ